MGVIVCGVCYTLKKFKFFSALIIKKILNYSKNKDKYLISRLKGILM